MNNELKIIDENGNEYITIEHASNICNVSKKGIMWHVNNKNIDKKYIANILVIKKQDVINLINRGDTIETDNT